MHLWMGGSGMMKSWDSKSGWSIILTKIIEQSLKLLLKSRIHSMPPFPTSSRLQCCHSHIPQPVEFPSIVSLTSVLLLYTVLRCVCPALYVAMLLSRWVNGFLYIMNGCEPMILGCCDVCVSGSLCNHACVSWIMV